MQKSQFPVNLFWALTTHFIAGLLRFGLLPPDAQKHFYNGSPKVFLNGVEIFGGFMNYTISVDAIYVIMDNDH